MVLASRSRRNMILFALTIVGLIVAVLLFQRYVSTTPLIVVEGASMLPTLYTGDIVIVYKPSPEDIKTGDIIVYKSSDRLVIHRVIEVVKCGNDYCYITKGDNNPIADNIMGLQPSHGVSYDNVIGVVIGIRFGNMSAPLRIPYLGLLTIIIH